MGVIHAYYHTRFKPFRGASGDTEAVSCHVNKLTRAQFVTFKHVWRNRAVYIGWFRDWSPNQDYALPNRKDYFAVRAGIYDDGKGNAFVPGTNKTLMITPEGELQIWQDGRKVR